MITATFHISYEMHWPRRHGDEPRSTFGNQRVSVRAGEGAVNLADHLHVVEEGVEGVEVGEAHHVGGAASGRLQTEASE